MGPVVVKKSAFFYSIGNRALNFSMGKTEELRCELPFFELGDPLEAHPLTNII
jgi:hypothetical protein